MIVSVWIIFFLLTTIVSSVFAGGCGGCGYCTKILPCVRGTCYTADGGEHYWCSCYTGWTSTNCNIVDCSSSIHCLNGGTCIPINGGTDKTCVCAYGWTGSNCEEIDVCTPYENADIVFAIDVSLSQGEPSDFEQKKSFVKNFISKFPIGPFDYRFQFSVLTFSFEATIHFYLNEYQNMTDLLAAVDGIATAKPGVTYTWTMLKTVQEEIFNVSNGARNSVKRYLVVLTDGLSNDLQDTRTQAEYLRSMGVNTYAVGTGPSVSHQGLIEIATYYDHVFSMISPDALQSLLHKSMFGCDDCSKQMTDVALLLDVSSSTTTRQLDSLIKAVTQIVKLSNIGTSAVQFSFATFSNNHVPVYNLNKYTDAADHIFAIHSNIAVNSVDVSSVSDALTYILTDTFLLTNGGRNESRKIAIVLTAGNFSDNADDIQTKAQNLKDNGVIIVAVGISRYTNITNLMTVASDPSLIYVLGEDMFTDVDVLDSLKSLIEYSDCSQFS